MLLSLQWPILKSLQWMAFESGTHSRYIAAHEIAVAIGNPMATVLPMFHALTGCDTVSSFFGHGKKTAWQVWQVFPQLTEAMEDLMACPQSISVEVMVFLERFVTMS